MTSRQDQDANRQSPPEGTGGLHNRKWYVPQDVPMTILTLFGFLAVCIYTAYARQQVIKTGQSNEIALKALREANEPFVTWAQFSFTRQRPTDEDQYKLTIGPVWTNWGNTPASSAKTTMCAPIVRDDATPPHLFCHVTDDAGGIAVIGPKQSVAISGVTVDENDLAATRNGKKYIYIFGRIDYTDTVDVKADGTPKPRLTWFCQRPIEISPIEGAPPVPPGSLPPIIALGCPTLNCADDACIDIPKSDQ